MGAPNVITLGGQPFEVAPVPFGRLRGIIAAMNRMQAAGMQSETAMEESAVVFALLLNKPREEIDAMPIGVAEMVAALEKVPGLCGIDQAKPGE